MNGDEFVRDRKMEFTYLPIDHKDCDESQAAFLLLLI